MKFGLGILLFVGCETTHCSGETFVTDTGLYTKIVPVVKQRLQLSDNCKVCASGHECTYFHCCNSDADCAGDELCNCTTLDCGLAPQEVSTDNGPLLNTCVNYKSRIEIPLPIRVGKGWSFEQDNNHHIFESNWAALNCLHEFCDKVIDLPSKEPKREERP